MRDEQPLRKRRMIDAVIIGAVVACLAFAAVRVTLAAADASFFHYAARRNAAIAKSAGRPPAKSIPQRFVALWSFGRWWGHRQRPYLGGGDYLEVVSHAKTARTLGVAVGFIDRQLRQEGAPIDRMLLPSDRARLYGRKPGILFTRADGTRYRNSWTTPAQDASLFSDIPQLTKDYDPLITVAQSRGLAKRTRLTERSQGVFVAAPVPSGSGTWILLARDSWPRRFYIVPIELSPVGGGL